MKHLWCADSIISGSLHVRVCVPIRKPGGRKKQGTGTYQYALAAPNLKSPTGGTWPPPCCDVEHTTARTSSSSSRQPGVSTRRGRAVFHSFSFAHLPAAGSKQQHVRAVVPVAGGILPQIVWQSPHNLLKQRCCYCVEHHVREGKPLWEPLCAFQQPTLTIYS